MSSSGQTRGRRTACVYRGVFPVMGDGAGRAYRCPRFSRNCSLHLHPRHCCRRVFLRRHVTVFTLTSTRSRGTSCDCYSDVGERACGGGDGGRSVAGAQCARLLCRDEQSGRLQHGQQGHLVADAARGPLRLAGCRCRMLGALQTVPTVQCRLPFRPLL